MGHRIVGRKPEDVEHTNRILEARVSALEKQMAFLLKVNGLDLSGMRRADDETLLTLYQDAVQLVAVIHKGIALEIVERWAEFFLQLSEYEFTRLQPIVEFDHTWEPFYLLCTKLMTQVRQHKQLPESVRIQQLYAILDKGRSNLRDSAILMCRKYPKSLTARGRTLLKNDDLLAYLA